VGRRGYPPEFRRKVLDLLGEGRSVARVAHDLDISEQSIYSWRRQDRIEQGLIAELTSTEKAELTAAKKRIADLETELAVARRAMELLRAEASPKAVLGGTQVELLDGKKWTTRVELANAIFDHLEVWHNRRRRHSRLGMLTPIQLERTSIITVACESRFPTPPQPGQSSVHQTRNGSNYDWDATARSVRCGVTRSSWTAGLTAHVGNHSSNQVLSGHGTDASDDSGSDAR
jgi:transposase